MPESFLLVRPDLKDALAAGRPVVALESTLIAHGLPRPLNLDTALALEAVVRDHDALPATIGIVDGRIKVGLEVGELERFAQGENIAKVSRRDLATVVAQGGSGATTVAATMLCARLAGIRVFATGGIGGVHRSVQTTLDISADLTELGRTAVTVVCAGAKSILDLPKTLEVLETHGVPVLGFGTDSFPAFYVRDSGLPVDTRVESAREVAQIVRVRTELGLQGGMVVAVPVPQAQALGEKLVEGWIAQASSEARVKGVSGKALTPFLLGRIAQLSEGRALETNVTLVKNNARVAAEIAAALSFEVG
ncbi:MAG: pseudouridine-5'-phosphate glycosidase [Candidatus Competibacteraceae bacterium]|nr:pseudouridine-5'-phosphate glycosidase [Candidatus Competibacteraceae bacterium]